MAGPGDVSKKATLNEVAAAAGVSTRTVSRVVNAEGGYSEDTRRRVLDLVDELGYRPNLAARSLVTRRTRTLGLVVTSLSDPFFPSLAEGVVREAKSRGHDLFLSATQDDAHLQVEVLDSMVSHGVDAAVVFPATGGDDDLRAAVRSGLPIVSIDHALRGPGLGTVQSDIAAGGRLAAEFLVGEVEGPIAMIGLTGGRAGWRETGFRDVLEAAGRPFIVARVDATTEGGRTAVRSLLVEQPELAGVFAYNDLAAIGAMAELQALGKKVPADVAVVGFDDIPLAEFTAPSLTTIRLDRERVGVEAVELAIRLAGEPGLEPEPVVVPVGLVRRESA